MPPPSLPIHSPSPTPRMAETSPSGALPHLISAQAHFICEARTEKGQGITAGRLSPSPGASCPLSLPPVSTSHPRVLLLMSAGDRAQPVCSGAACPEASLLLLPCRYLDEEGLQLNLLQLQCLPHQAPHPHGAAQGALEGARALGGWAGVHQRLHHPAPRVLLGPVTRTVPRPGSA